jgi:hypothetical protein
VTITRTRTVLNLKSPADSWQPEETSSTHRAYLLYEIFAFNTQALILVIFSALTLVAEPSFASIAFISFGQLCAKAKDEAENNRIAKTFFMKISLLRNGS